MPIAWPFHPAITVNFLSCFCILIILTVCAWLRHSCMTAACVCMLSVHACWVCMHAECACMLSVQACWVCLRTECACVLSVPCMLSVPCTLSVQTFWVCKHAECASMLRHTCLLPWACIASIHFLPDCLLTTTPANNVFKSLFFFFCQQHARLSSDQSTFIAEHLSVKQANLHMHTCSVFSCTCIPVLSLPCICITCNAASAPSRLLLWLSKGVDLFALLAACTWLYFLHSC